MIPRKTDRSVIHIDIAHFAVAVERRLDTGLKGRPVVIAQKKSARTPVYDLSEEAFSCGIRKGMPVLNALKLCNKCHILPPHPARYAQAMQSILKQAACYTPLIEPGMDDGHVFLDVTGTSRLFGPPADMAWRLEKQIKTDLAIPPSWSVATNKLVAKVATRLVKPLGEYIVAPGDEEALLAPLPMAMIPGVRPWDLDTLAGFHISGVNQLKPWTRQQLAVPFGDHGHYLYDAIRGIDSSPVRPPEPAAPAITLDHTFREDTNSRDDMEQALYRLVEQGGRVLRASRRFAGLAGVIVTYQDGSTRARQVKITPPSATDPTLFTSARRSLSMALNRRIRVNHIRLVLKKLVFPPIQQDLFDNESREKETRMTTAMDAIRDKFGDIAIMTGRMMGPGTPRTAFP